jgi:putative thioredoxin
MSPSAFIHDVGDEDFEQRVIARSHQVPVVVDFWAAWCGPCRALGPLIEREVGALGGRVELAKVDTDAAPATAGRYRVMSIPTVMAFHEGEPVDSFVGAQPAPVVRSFLARLAPSEEQQQLDRAREAVAAGRLDEARALLRPLSEGGGGDVATPATLLLARMALGTGSPGEVESLLQRIDPRHPDAAQAEVLRELGALAVEVAAYGGEQRARETLARDAGDLDARFALAGILATSGRADEALDHLLEIVARSRKYRDDAARRLLLVLFEHLGPDSERVRESRRLLQVLT